jgi:drug/metabolite transporter (DMT)-like permease
MRLLHSAPIRAGVWAGHKFARIKDYVARLRFSSLVQSALNSPHSAPAAALLLFILGGFCLSSLDAIGKLALSEAGLALLVWARYAGQVLISLPLAYRFAGSGFWKTQKPAIQCGRSILLLLTTVLFFAGIQWLPLAEASAISFTAPLWVALLSGPALGERVARNDWLVAAIGFSGILLIVRPGTEVFHPAALLIAAMAFLSAIFQLLTRKLTSDNPFTTFFYSGLVGAAASSILIIYVGVPELLSPTTVLALAATGILGGLGHLLFVLAFYRASPSTLTPFVYLQMIWAIGFGWLLFNQLPDFLALIGMSIIVGSGLWLVLSRHASRS